MAESCRASPNQERSPFPDWPQNPDPTWVPDYMRDAQDALIKLSNSRAQPPEDRTFVWTPLTDKILGLFEFERDFTEGDVPEVIRLCTESMGKTPTREQVWQRHEDHKQAGRIIRGEQTGMVTLKVPQKKKKGEDDEVL